MVFWEFPGSEYGGLLLRHVIVQHHLKMSSKPAIRQGLRAFCVQGGPLQFEQIWLYLLVLSGVCTNTPHVGTNTVPTVTQKNPAISIRSNKKNGFLRNGRYQHGWNYQQINRVGT